MGFTMSVLWRRVGRQQDFRADHAALAGVVGGAVFKALDLMLFLCKLAFDFLFLGLQLLNFFFVYDLDLLTVKDRLRFR